MSEYITINLTQPKEEIKFSYTEQNEEIVFSFSEAARGAQGEPGAAATVDQTIIDGSTNAVSGNAVFDGLALKAPIANPTFTGTVTAPHIHGSIAGNLYVHVRNDSGGALSRGTPIYITGNVGDTDRVRVAAADHTNSAKMPAIGLLDQDLNHNGDGNAIIVGELPSSNTNAYSLNQELYVGVGAITGTKPTTGEVQSVGTVARVQTNTGVIVVNMQGRRTPDAAFAAAVHTHVSADITDATASATPSTIVKRDSEGRAFFASTTFGNPAVTGTSTDGHGISGVSTNGSGLVGSSTNGLGAFISSISSTGGTIQSSTGTGARTRTISGTNHHEFGTISGDDRSFIRRVLGLFGWNRGSFVQTLGSPATLTADSAIELPDISSGTIALTSDSRFTDERVPTAAGLTSKFSTNKATIANGDKFTILDSAASDVPKHTLWSLIVSTLTTAFNALYVGLTGNQTIAGNKTFSGQTELTGQAATNSTSAMTRGLVESARKLRTNEKVYGCYTATASGGGASAGANTYGLGYAQLIAGTATSSYAYGYYALESTNNGFASGSGTNFGANWELTGSFRHSASDNHEGIFRLGVAVLSNATNLANANAFSSIGIGFEFGRISTNINQARIIYHDGSTYKTSAWVTVYTGDPVQREFSYRLHNNGSGTITLYMTISGSNNTGSPSMLNIASLVSVTDGPTGVSANSSGIYWSAVNSSATYTIGLGRLSPSPILMTF